MIPFCFAPYVSWALVFQSIPADTIDLQRHAQGCYSQEMYCNMAADAANHAFNLDGYGKSRQAHCEENPKYDPK